MKRSRKRSVLAFVPLFCYTIIYLLADFSSLWEVVVVAAVLVILSLSQFVDGDLAAEERHAEIWTDCPKVQFERLMKAKQN